MDWKIFTKAILDAELDNGTQPQILISLFKSAGYISRKEDGISEGTAKSWIAGTRHCKSSSYFPNNRLENPTGTFNFFRKRPNNKLKKLQEIFKECKTEDSPINCETDDLDIFCWSLVDQFLDLLKMQRIGTGGLQTSTNNPEMISNVNENKPDNEKIPSHENEIYPQYKNTGSHLSISRDYQICLCCKNWNNNTKLALKNISNEYGICKVLGQSTSGAENCICNKFTENYNRISLYDIYRKSHKI